MEKQTMKVKDAYVATVKNEVADKARIFYASNEKPLNNDIFVNDSVFPTITPEKPVEDNTINNSADITIPAELNINEAEKNSLDTNVNVKIPEPIVKDALNDIVKSTETVPTEPLQENKEEVVENIVPTVSPEAINFTVSEPVAEVTAPKVEEVSSVQVNVNPTAEVPVNDAPSAPAVNAAIPTSVDMGIPNLNILEAVPSQPETPIPAPMPAAPETTVNPIPIPNPVNTPAEVKPIVDNAMVIDQMASNVATNEIPTAPKFDASHETNLLGALAENNSAPAMGNVTVTPDNLNMVRDFGVDALAEGNTPKAKPSMGFINSKILLVVVVTFFLASCVFLGYEIYKYFTLPK